TAGSSTGEPGMYCETALCGPQGTCCAAGEECIEEQCHAPCDTDIRCGADLSECCAEGEVCLGDACVAPSGACIDSYDCADGEYCEPNIDLCLPETMPAVCELTPPDFTTIDLQLEWSYEIDQVQSGPLVADVDGDSLPEVILNTYYEGGVSWRAEIIVLDGTNGNVQFIGTHDPANEVFGSYSRTAPAVGDVSGDGTPDIVYSGYPEVNIPVGPPFPDNSSLIHAMDGQGQHLWTSHAPDGSPYYVYIRNGGVTLVNLDADEASEVVLGTTIFDDDGTLVFDQDSGNGLGGAAYGSNGNVTGGMSVVADLTGDGYPEIISGRHAWTVDWVDGTPPTATLTPLWTYAGPDGTPAVADLDLDGDPEVVLVGDPAPFSLPYNGQLQILDGATGELWCGIDPTGAMCAGMDMLRTQPLPLFGGGRGGQPIIADFDGDGRPEIGVAGATAYTVYDLNRAGEDVVQPMGDPPPALGAVYPRWNSPAQDDPTDVTGASAFDFQGDGAAEVIYGDQCYSRIYDGATGTVMNEMQRSAWSLHTYAVAADVDDDGDTELLVVANDNQADANCTMSIPGFTPQRGVFVYSDPNDQWVRTRQVWNGHGYHVTNATSLGLVPTAETNNWDDPNLNNYRQSIDRGGLFNAPDLVVSLALGVTGCDDDDVEIFATIRNVGAFSVGSGIDVSLYRGTDASGTLLSTQQTSQTMLPGGQTRLSWLVSVDDAMPADFYVVVDNDDGVPTEGTITECVEDNNSATLTSVTCPEPM
ncbi:MAG: VCBS repeat-containing protein, partial [Myxococcales bacterium]|nr:VCBS repeat-containing protein [Myxococcales bacterium]